jgi:hypothetical protein
MQDVESRFSKVERVVGPDRPAAAVLQVVKSRNAAIRLLPMFGAH